MLGKSIAGFALLLLVSTAFASNVPRLTGGNHRAASAGRPGDCDSGQPCLRVHRNDEDFRSYKVVNFEEVEIHQAATDNARIVHEKIVRETGFDCKNAKYDSETGSFNCEGGGVLYTRHDLLRKVLELLYGK